MLAKPTGPTLVQFLTKHEEDLYRSDTVSVPYLPLIFNWALQALSGLAFVHSHNIIFNDLKLLLVGFMGAEFRDEWAQSPNMASGPLLTSRYL